MGAVNLRAWDGTNKSWVKLLVDAAGHVQVDVASAALPTGAATEAKQDTTLTELQQKLETGDLSIEAVTKYLATNVKNFPSEYPLQAAQVTDLKKPSVQNWPADFPLPAAQVTDLKAITSYPDPIISQATPEDLKHTPHGYYAGGPSYLPYAVDVGGRLRIVSANEDIGARAYHDAAQAITDLTWTILSLNSERYDTDTIHDLTTNNSRLTCKTAGKYLIVSNLRWEGNATGVRVSALYLNNATVIGKIGQAPPGTSEFDMSLATIYSLAVNDYVEVRVYQSSGVALNALAVGNYAPEFMMQRIG